MQTTERRKRQNCGDSFYGHHRTFGGTGQMELGPNVSMAAERNGSHCHGPVFAGVQGGMTQGNRQHTRNFQFGGSEAGSGVFPSFSLNSERTSNSLWNAVSPGSDEGTLPFSASNPAENFRNNFHLYMRGESRNSYKRKSPMDSSAVSLTSRAFSGQREGEFVGYTQVSGTRRPDTSLIPAYGGPQFTRDSPSVFQCSRTGAISQNEMTNRHDIVNTPHSRESYRSASIIGGLPSQASMPRRMATTMIGSAGLPEILSYSQGNGLCGTGTWSANNTFVEEGNNQAGFVNHGNQRRHNLSEASEMFGISSIDTRLLQSSNRTSRSVHLRMFNAHASHQGAPNPYAHGGTVDLQPPAMSAARQLSRFTSVHHQGGLLRFPPSGSASALNNMMSGSQATYGDAYPVRAMPPVLPRNHDSNRSYVHHVSFREQRASPSEGMNDHRFGASHELFDQSVVYGGGNFVDIHDQHSNMRLDVDSMSYEELLALEERIGNVNTGLSEDNADKCLKISTYACADVTSEGSSQESDLKCSICQEEYVEGDELGQLDCGHGYHTSCINQWLLLKNQCPICKAAACSKANDN